MEKSLIYAQMILVVLFVFGCSGSNTSGNKTAKSTSNYQPASVKEYIEKFHSVTVMGSQIDAGNGQAVLVVNGSVTRYDIFESTTPVSKIKSVKISRSQNDVRKYTNSSLYTAVILVRTD